MSILTSRASGASPRDRDRGTGYELLERAFLNKQLGVGPFASDRPFNQSDERAEDADEAEEVENIFLLSYEEFLKNIFQSIEEGST